MFMDLQSITVSFTLDFSTIIPYSITNILIFKIFVAYRNQHNHFRF